MPKITHILFGLVIVGLCVSLYLYKRSITNREMFSERVNTVNQVLLLLERTEGLKNILRSNVFARGNVQDTAMMFTVDAKLELDSVLSA